MKKLLLTFSALALMASAALADTGLFGGYIVLTLNGGGANFYKLENPGDNTTPPFSGVNFGIFDPSLGQSFTLSGGEAETFKNGGSNVTAAQLNFRIYPTGSPTGSFTSLNLPFNSDLGTNGDQKWQDLVASTNLLTGLTNGNYTLEVYVGANTSDGDRFFNNGGANYTATFSVVPEPSALALIAGPAVLGAFFFRSPSARLTSRSQIQEAPLRAGAFLFEHLNGNSSAFVEALNFAPEVRGCVESDRIVSRYSEGELDRIYRMNRI